MKTEVVSVRLDPATVERLDKAAQCLRCTRAEMVAVALGRYLPMVVPDEPEGRLPPPRRVGSPYIWRVRLRVDGAETERIFPTREKRQAFLARLARFGDRVRVLALDQLE